MYTSKQNPLQKQNYNLFWGQVTDPNMGGKISVTVIATGFDAAKASEEKAKVAEQVKPKVVSNETLFSSDEFSSILTPRKTKESAPQPVVEKSETQVKNDNAHPASESETQKPWGENLFNDTEVKPVRGTLKVDPPEDVDVNDLEKPAIWANKKLNRFIRLDEE